MDIRYTTVQHEQDVYTILDLQAANLQAAISPETARSPSYSSSSKYTL